MVVTVLNIYGELEEASGNGNGTRQRGWAFRFDDWPLIGHANNAP